MNQLTAIMPNYNDADLIPAAVDGVLAQTRQPDEIIIVDDGSTDHSAEVIQAQTKKDARIRVLTNPTNLGVVGGFNRALSETKTKYVCFVSMDDATHPTWLEKSMALLAEHPDASICFSDLYIFNEDQNTIFELGARIADKPTFFTPNDFADILAGHHISGTAVVVDTQAFIKAGGYLQPLKWHSDWFGWLTLSFRTGVCHIPEPLVYLRDRDVSHSRVGMNNPDHQREVINNFLRIIQQPEYRDVFPYFIRSEAVRALGDSVVTAVMDQPEFWKPELWMLIQGAAQARTARLATQFHRRTQANTYTTKPYL